MVIAESLLPFLMLLVFLPIVVVGMLIWCAHMFFDYLRNVVRNQRRYLIARLRFSLEEAMFSTSASYWSGIIAAVGSLVVPALLSIGLHRAYQDFASIGHWSDVTVTIYFVMMMAAFALWHSTLLYLPHAFVRPLSSFTAYPRWRNFMISFALTYALLSYGLTWFPTLGFPGFYFGSLVLNFIVPLPTVYLMCIILSLALFVIRLSLKPFADINSSPDRSYS